MPFDGMNNTGADRFLRLRHLLTELEMDDNFLLQPAVWLVGSPSGACAGCLIGYALRRGTFEQDGLISAKANSPNEFVPQYHDLEGFDAVAAFFDIDHREAHDLFYYLICEYNFAKLDQRLDEHITNRCMAT